ncbi:PIF1 helicase, partial [Striga hermonthica]
LVLSDDEVKNLALVKVEKILRRCGSTLRDYSTMPFPNLDRNEASTNRLVMDELNYDRRALAIENQELVANMTDEQRNVYGSIMDFVYRTYGRMFFVYGYGGTGKTYVWRALSSALRSKGEIVLNVASSGIASLLLPGGRTAHSRFKIPLNPVEGSTCDISQQSPLAELIIRCRLIIWDEAPMMNKYCFQAVDNTLRALMEVVDPSRKNLPFGGKCVVLGGDFRQILPVVPKGSRSDIVNATINSSKLWRDCIVLRLTRNMRLRSLGGGDEYDELRRFFEWLANIGDGTVGGSNDGCADIDIPDDILLHSQGDPIGTIVESTYPMFGSAGDDLSYLKDRAILAPTLDVVESVNEYMSSMNSSEGRTYLSSYTACKSDAGYDSLQDLHTPEFLNGIKCSRLPNHKLHLKVGTPVMLLRNIDHSMGLCNGY